MLALSAFHLPGVTGTTPAYAINVTSTADAPWAGGGFTCVSTNGQCTLRSTIDAFNHSGSGPFDLNLTTAGVYTLTLGDGGEDGRLGTDASVGDLDILKYIRINNTSGGEVRIRGNFNYRIFHITAGGRLELNNVIVEDGWALTGGGGGGAYVNGANGGATLIANNVTFADNNTTAFGGGIHAVNGAVVQVTNSTFSHNTSAVAGGAIAGSGGQTITVTGSHFSTNFTVNNPQQFGGVIYSVGDLTVQSSDFFGNGALYTGNDAGAVLQGGVMLLNGNATLTNVTIGNNNVQGGPGAPYPGTGRGGAIFAADGAKVKINASTIAHNGAKDTGGGIEASTAAGTQVSVVNSLIAHNTAGQTPFGNCHNPLSSGGYNLEADVETAFNCNLLQDTDLRSTNARIPDIAVQDHGFFVFPLPPDSPAIDAANTSVSDTDPTGASCPTHDIRGLTRPNDGDGSGEAQCDIGAYEAADIPPPTLTGLIPSSITAGDAAFTLDVKGTGFISSSTVRWNGSSRPTTFVSATELTAEITATDIAGNSNNINTATVAVTNLSGTTTNALAFTITSSKVQAPQSSIADPGATSSSSTPPGAAGQPGVSATITNTGGTATTLTTARYDSNPVGGTFIDVGGGFVDLQVTGADPADKVTAKFYYPTTITGATETSLQLQYWTGNAWAPVLSSGGVAPAKDTTDNLDGTTSGGRWTVTFDATSAPPVTGLAGTVFGPTQGPAEATSTPTATATVTPTATPIVTPTVTPTATQPAQPPGPCSPRPNIQVTARPLSGGRLEAKLTAPTVSGTTNGFTQITFNLLQNGTVQLGTSTAGPGQTVQLGNVPTVTFIVTRQTAGQATHVAFTVRDSCGDWPSFVGGGPDAF